VSNEGGAVPVRGPLRAYIVNQTTHWFITGLLFPVLILIVLDKGLGLFEAGTVLAIFSGTALLLELPTGGLADSIGRKKVYILAVLVHIISVVAFLFSFDLLTVALAASFMGMGRALSSGSIDAWFVDEFKAANPGGNLQQALAKAQVAIPIGIGVGCLIGGILPMTLGRFLNAELGLTIFGANLLIALFADALQIVMTQRIIVETTYVPRANGWRDGFRNVPSVISTSITYGVRNRTVLVLLLVMMSLGFGISGLELLWQPRVSEIMGQDAQTWILGVLAAAYFLVTAVGSILSTPVCRRAHDNYSVVMTVLLVALGFSVFLLALQDQLVLFAAFYLLAYLIMGMTNSPYATLYNDEVPSEQRSTMLSFQSLLLQCGVLCGALVLGYIAGTSGIPVAWMVGSLAIAFSSIGFLYLRAVKSRTEARPGDPVAGPEHPPSSSQ
jgi:MFS family permease